MEIKLKVGSVKQFENGVTPLEVAKSLSQKLGKKALAANVNGKLADINLPLEKDCELDIFTFDDEGGR